MKIRQAVIHLSELGCVKTLLLPEYILTCKFSLLSEHPKEEEDDVVREGRILGGLEPSRAFGDARYKWPRAVQET